MHPKTGRNIRAILPLLCIGSLAGSFEIHRDAEPVFVQVGNKRVPTTLLRHLNNVDPSPVKVSRYGGRLDRREKATGFFYTLKTPAGWVLVDPEGYHTFNLGVNSTRPNDMVPDHQKAFASTFKDREDWAKKTYELLVEDLGFNALACWSDWELFKEAGVRIPYVRRWNLMATYGKKKGITYAKYGHAGFQNDVLPVFDPAFAEHCDAVCRKMAETQNDPWLIGHFTDNELPFKSTGIIQRYLSCASEDPSRIAVENWLREHGADRENITPQQDTAFASLVVSTYFKTVHDAIRKHDPHHLILGSRFHGQASTQDLCYTAAGPYVDVVSINYYHRWTPRQAELDRRADLASKPLLITEWYAKGTDSGLKNQAGAGFTVSSQQERGYFYENFTLGLLQNRNVVGWHWFRYIDDGDLKTKGKSSNKGIVDLDFKPYPELCDSMRSVHAKVYRLSDLFRSIPSESRQNTSE